MSTERTEASFRHDATSAGIILTGVVIGMTMYIWHAFVVWIVWLRMVTPYYGIEAPSIPHLYVLLLGMRLIIAAQVTPPTTGETLKLALKDAALGGFFRSGAVLLITLAVSRWVL